MADLELVLELFSHSEVEECPSNFFSGCGGAAACRGGATDARHPSQPMAPNG